MNHFFAKSYQRTLKRVYNINLKNKNPNKESYYYLQKELEKTDFRSNKFLNLLPSADLSILMSQPCPVIQNNHPENEDNYLKFRKGVNNQIMMHSKKIRKCMNIKESRACEKCPVAKNCHLKNEEARKPVCSVSDLLLYMYWMTKTIPYDGETLEMDQFEKYLAGVRVLDSLEPLIQMNFTDM